MKRKRLDRGAWWSYNNVRPPIYHQMRIDNDKFHGMVCLLQLIDGEYKYWDFPIAGKAAVIGKGMIWLQLIPDGKSHVITAKYLPKKKTIRGIEYPNSVSVWYVDIIERVEYDPDGVAVFIDKYLDVIFTPQGDVDIDDRDELDEALKTGDITKLQYEQAIAECSDVVESLTTNIEETEILCSEILSECCRNIETAQRQ